MSRRNRRQLSKTAAFMQAPRSTEFNPDYTTSGETCAGIGIPLEASPRSLLVLALVLR